MTEDYKQREKASGIKPGDMVKVIRKCRSHENGWDNDWAEEMDSTVGKIYTVKAFSTKDDKGIGLGNRSICDPDKHWFYPYFVLQKIVEIPEIEVKKVIINIGGKQIEIREEIYNLIKDDL